MAQKSQFGKLIVNQVALNNLLNITEQSLKKPNHLI